MSQVYRRLQVYEKDEAPDAYEGVNFYEWIINPDSFSESVENLFYTSFLIREGKLAVNVDEQGVPRMCTSAVFENQADGTIAYVDSHPMYRRCCRWRQWRSCSKHSAKDPRGPAI